MSSELMSRLLTIALEAIERDERTGDLLLELLAEYARDVAA